MSLYPHQMKKLLGDVERRGEERKPYGTLRQQKNQNQIRTWNGNGMKFLLFFFFFYSGPSSETSILRHYHHAHTLYPFFTLLQPPCACMFIFYFISLYSFSKSKSRRAFSFFVCFFFFLYLILTCSLGAWPEPYLPNDSMVSFFSFFFFLYI